MRLIGIVTGGVILVLAGVGALFDYRMWHGRSGRPPMREHGDRW